MSEPDAGPQAVKVTMLLADAAHSVGGKLYILGGGWTQLQASGPVSMALALKLEIPWSMANERLELDASLETEDGAAVGTDERPIQAGGEIEVGRPPGLKPGTPLVATLSLNFAGIHLEPGGYVWVLKIGPEIVERAQFRVQGQEGYSE
jgi:hypothetical protein